MPTLIRAFLILILVGGVTFLYLLGLFSPGPIVNTLEYNTDNTAYDLLDKNVNCKIPDVDPFDKSIIRFIKRKGELQCSGKPSITYEEGRMLRLNRTVINNVYKGNFSYCQYQPILRGPKENDGDITYGDFEDSFSSDVKLKYEFVRVFCYNKLDRRIYTNFHAIILPKPQVKDQSDRKFQKYLIQHKPKEALSVLILAIDSTSRLNFIRQMPTTRQFLLRDLGAIEMRGYTKIADNTYPNMVALTLGKYVRELNWNSSMTFDKYNFIWKQFSKNGFTTLMAEDTPNWATFNYIKKGFGKPPVDYYYRPFSLAMERHGSVWHNGHHCVNDRMEASIALNYVRDFALQNIGKPYFVYSFLTRITHDYINNAGLLDKPVHLFLKELKANGVFENTVLVFVSDHGMRYGGIRNTFIGKAGERLPMLYLAFPSWFLKKYPDITQNVLLNSKRLSTPFDVYETMKDILYFDGQISKNETFGRGISFFRKIPESRTCKEASILPHWCMCFTWKKLANTCKTALRVAGALLSNINEQLNDFKDKCAHLKLSYVKDARFLIPDDVILPTNTSLTDVDLQRKDHKGERTEVLTLYQLSIVSKPGDAMFEATISYNLKTHKYAVSGDISRTNMYGNQSKCIQNFHLQKFCFCIVK